MPYNSFNWKHLFKDFVVTSITILADIQDSIHEQASLTEAAKSSTSLISREVPEWILKFVEKVCHNGKKAATTQKSKIPRRFKRFDWKKKTLGVDEEDSFLATSV
jgi:hypothetical protein